MSSPGPVAVPPPATPPRSTGRRLHGAIAHRLGTAILSGEFAPGQVLSSEVAFAEALDVSRSAFREALQALAAKGLVESRPKTGTRVLPRDRWNLLDPDVLAWAFASEPDLDYVRDLFELRLIVEPAAAALAAERRTGEDVRELSAALAGMRRHTLATEAGRAADRAFHACLLRATRNLVMTTLAASIGSAVNWTTLFKHRGPGRPRDPLADHARVFEAVAASDPEAARSAMEALVMLALADTREKMTR